MIKRLQSDREKSSSQALIVVLLAVTLLSTIIVAFLLTAGLYHSVSRQDYQAQAAQALAVTGLNSALTQIRSALGPWDDPYNNFCGGNATSAAPTFYWSTSPGIITRWSYTSTTPQTNYPLFSRSAYGDTNLANLNVPTSDGIYPVIGGANPPAIQVYWANVLQNPSYSPASTNRMIGRYAFWVDDESAKININTADGTMKYQTNSLGLGTPSEVSLQTLQQTNDNISATLATNIVYIARTTGFNSVPDILRATGTTQDIWTNNVFNLTTCSRSPDLNIFGQPKMALMPMLEDTSDNLANNTNTLNGITLQPIKEIYPTPSQLPPYPLTIVNYPNYLPAVSNSNVPWPLAFRQEVSIYNTGELNSFVSNVQRLSGHYPWMNGMMLAKYLAGTNAMGQAINWPTFPGTSVPAAGFLGKYSPRQIDSIVAQVLSYGSKLISPDYCYTSDSGRPPETSLEGYYLPGFEGRRTITVPFLFPGWLTGEWVNGIGRTPSATGVLMEFQTYGSNGDPTVPHHQPETDLNIWAEFWLPAAYLGGNNVIPTQMYGYILPITVGGGGYGNSTLNQWDEADAQEGLVPQHASSIPNSTNGPSYWGNQLLNDNQGIDFEGNSPAVDDPDQGLAKQYHDPWALEAPPSTNYYGGGPNILPDSPFLLPRLQTPSPAQDWAPGEMRCIGGQYSDPAEGNPIAMNMQAIANGSTLQIGGGMTVNVNIAVSGTDAEFVPLEINRGNAYANPDLDTEGWLNPSNSPTNATTPSTQTVRDRVLQSVIPVNFSMQVPSEGGGDALGNTEYVLARVADPLVNKFPGDWMVTYYANSAPTSTMPYTLSAQTASGLTSYSEYDSGFHTNLADPDSYWVPQADCTASYNSASAAVQTLIPRSARFPNIGYLQYMRTGIIPDDESLAYSPQPGQLPSQYQHGTPFRLLSYAPSTNTANQQTTFGGSQPYPDWAMLDLLYVPFIMAPYSGPYGYYDPNNNNQWTGYGSPSVLANYSTYGGSTPGRINPNGAVIYTTNTTTPLPGVSRTLPMQAVLQGLMVNQTNIANPITPTNFNPGFGGGSSVDAPTIAQAIATYLTSNGPLRMPAELCNVPEIAALRPNGVNATANNPTRNDLIRQILGALTTQSNVFSVWTVGQTVMKKPTNTGYGIFEVGDTVLAERRLHYIVERYLDPGADGVYGNTSSAGVDGVVGTYDDPVDTNNHPYCPRYLYRVISAEEIR